MCRGDLGWCSAIGEWAHVIGPLAGGLAGDGLVGQGRLAFPDFRGRLIPWLNVLDHVGVEVLHCGEHGVDERAVALAACRAGVTGQREGEGPQFVAGFVEQ